MLTLPLLLPTVVGDPEAPAPAAPARGQLALLVAPTLEPILTDAELDTLLLSARRPDAAGAAPDQAEWVPTYDIEAAACAAWEVKAGRAASRFQFSTDGQGFNPQQIHAQCLKMAELYRRGRGSTTVPSALVDSLVSRAPC